MTVEELRIGNLVDIGKEVNELELVDFVDMYENDTLKHFDPIPLNKDWLVKLGFKQMYFLGAKINYYVKGNLIYSIIDRHVEYKNGSINFIIRKCEHVHDLQNLYHAITGEELTLKTK